MSKKPPLFQTVVALNYLPFALTLAESLHKQIPVSRLCVLITDATSSLLARVRHEFGPEIEFIGCDDLGQQALGNAREYYSILEFNSACKVLALDYQIRVRGELECYFIDPDMLVLGDFCELARTQGRDIVVTPHAMRPYPDDGQLPTDTELAAAGYVNGGFIYVRNSKRANEVLSWLVRQTRYGWFVAPEYGMYADQHWLSMSLFVFEEAVGLLRSPAINIAYWNLHERPLSDTGNEIWVCGDARQRALLFHFSGFSVPSGGHLTKHAHRRFDMETQRAIANLIDRYEGLLNSHQQRVASSAIHGDLKFSRAPLAVRMKRAQVLWGHRFLEFAPPTGRFSRLGKALDRLLS